MNIRVFHTGLLVAASTASLVPMPVQAQPGAPVDAQREGGARKEQMQAEALKHLSPLAGALFTLVRGSFESPQAKQEAIRQWHATYGTALKRESDARRETKHPDREKLEKEASVQLENTLDEQVKAGNLGKLEAEFIKVTRIRLDSGEHRRDAIEKWREMNGSALDAERDKWRARNVRLVDPQQEKASASSQHLDKARQNGHIGARHAELMRLNESRDLSPASRQLAIQQWMDAHGEKFKTEQAERRLEILNEESSLPHP